MWESVSSADIRGLLGEDDLPGIDDCPGRVVVSSHAQLAYLERVDANEPYPAARVREAWNRSETESHPSARTSPNGLRLVYQLDRGDDVTILTVYPRDESPTAPTLQEGTQ